MTSVAPRPEPLVARTREIDAIPDVLAAFDPHGFAWLHDGAGFVTSGVARTVGPDEAEAVLEAMEVDDEVGVPGTGAIAVGALPFDPQAEGRLVVPSRVVGRDADGRTWLTEIAPALRVPAPPAAPPSVLTVRAETTREEWADAVRTILAAIARGDVDKVVLARDVLVEADAPFDLGSVLGTLRSTQPGCFVFADGGFVGASPELLVRRRGSRVESRPMAGTAPTTDDAAIAALVASAKDAHEHRLTAQAVVDALAPWCGARPLAAAPDVARLADVAHLATSINGELTPGAPGALGLARLLHPTPAVGGTPTAAALALIAAVEPRGRGCYAGPVGWVDHRGDGELAVGLRSAHVDGARARLLAGAGIVAGSDPDAEWREATAKLEPMLRALVRL